MKKLLFLFFTVALFGFSSCGNDDDVTYRDITVNFATTEVGIDTEETSQDIVINLSRKADVSIDVTISLTSDILVYGDDFTTNPAVSDNMLKVTIPSGSTSASFKVLKKDGKFFDGNESIAFAITKLSATEGIVIGDKKGCTLKFGAILSAGNTLTLEGKAGDIVYANSVYVDFSSNAQTAIDRKSWDLAFYCGSDFRIVLNPAYAVTATASTKTDITAVTLEDANAAINIGATAMSEEGLSVEAVDSFDGDLTKTVFASVSDKDAENKVYFVASETTKTSRDQWYKVKVSRNGEGYKVQYGKVGGTTVKTVEIAKDDAYNFSFLSLESGKVVNVEPKAKKWDIMWSYYIGSTMGKPYFMQDMVMLNNVGGAEAAEVIIPEKEGLSATELAVYYKAYFDDFSKTDISALTFSKTRNVIANNWRVTALMGGATGSIGIKKDHFYIIKDPNGSYYKLKFNQMGLNNDGGERGRPVVEYKLVK